MSDHICDRCYRVRKKEDGIYHPVQIATGQPFGWYVGADGSFCPDCFTAIYERANGVRKVEKGEEP